MLGEGRMDVLFYPAGDQDTKGNETVLVEESQGGSDKFLNLCFVVALVETVDEDGVREMAGVEIGIRTKLLEWADNKGVHLNSDRFRENEGVSFNSSPDIALERGSVLS